MYDSNARSHGQHGKCIYIAFAEKYLLDDLDVYLIF